MRRHPATPAPWQRDTLRSELLAQCRCATVGAGYALLVAAAVALPLTV